MAAALTAPLAGAQAFIGDKLVVTGTGFANTTAFTVKITTAEQSEGVTLKGTTSGGGALDISTIADVVFNIPGVWTIVASDGTDTLTQTIQVFE